MLDFIKNLFKRRYRVRQDGYAIRPSEDLKFNEAINLRVDQNYSAREEFLKHIFHRVLKKVFTEMGDEELRASFLTKAKLKRQKDKEFGVDEDGDLCVKTDTYSIISRERNMSKIKMERVTYDDAVMFVTHWPIMVYIDMIYAQLVDINDNERSTIYKTPIRVYMIVDDNDFTDLKTVDSKYRYRSINFMRFGIILPEFDSLNLKTKIYGDHVLPYIYDIALSDLDPKYSHITIRPYRFKDDKEVIDYMEDCDNQISIDNLDKNDEFVYRREISEFVELFKMIDRAKNNIFRLKKNEKFTPWTSCSKYKELK